MYSADDEESGDDLDAKERRRRKRVSSDQKAKHARKRGEKEDKYAKVHIGYLVDFYDSPRFVGLEASCRLAILAHVVDHHHTAVDELGGEVSGERAPYVRRDRKAGGPSGSYPW